jgi:cell wall-associated NlpC family hydrolase
MRTRAATRIAGVVAALAALGGVTAFAIPSNGMPKAPDNAAAKVLAAARSQLGDTYVYGANGPDAWDCSGLTSFLWRKFGGVEGMPRRSRDQQAWALPVSKADRLPGDLVFFGDPVTHVGIYQGNGRIIDASSSRGAVIERAIWTGDVVRYGRVPRAGAPRPGGAQAAPKPAAKPAAVATRLRAVPGPGHRPTTVPKEPTRAFVRRLRYGVGHGWAFRGTGPASYDAAGLVRRAWWKVGNGTLPATPAGIERLAKPVSLADLRMGDLVFWGKPAVHVAVYLGDGLMIDASKVLRVVSKRRVFASETVRFGRLTPRH